MRELAKSLNRFGWAMTVLGAQQAFGLLRRTDPDADRLSPEADLDAMSGAAERRLRGYFLRTFQAGDQVQRSAVDLAFGVATLEALDPGRAVSLSADLLGRSTAALRALLPGSGCTCDQPGD
jgi:hypothetical protein